MSSSTITASATSTPTSKVEDDANDADTDDDVVDVVGNLEEVRRRIEEARAERTHHDDDGDDDDDHEPSPSASVRLVAVSKTKPIGMIRTAYEHGGQRVFGENYVQELVGKAQELSSSSTAGSEPIHDIQWHFIGPLQSNKANALVKGVVPYASSLTIESIATLKVASKLNRAMQDLLRDGREDDGEDDEGIAASVSSTLAVFVQVNTSGEESKSGLKPDGSDVSDLCLDIIRTCPFLSLRGLMTIGAPGESQKAFDILRDCREDVLKVFSEQQQIQQQQQQQQIQQHDSIVFPTKLELSMGMSADYEQAVRHGATNVRVGSTIFGQRDYSRK